jgi:hypothetical protein
VSRDLDFFLEQHEDLEALARALEEAGPVVFDQRDERTINCTFNDTKVQVLDASSQRILRPTIPVGGVRVASVADIFAMKLKVIGDRGELRDYFDLMAIEKTEGLRAEEGLAWALDKYNPRDRTEFISRTVRALGHTDDLLEDPGLPVSRAEIVSYWARRKADLRRRG